MLVEWCRHCLVLACRHHSLEYNSACSSHAAGVHGQRCWQGLQELNLLASGRHPQLLLPQQQPGAPRAWTVQALLGPLATTPLVGGVASGPKGGACAMAEHKQSPAWQACVAWGHAMLVLLLLLLDVTKTGKDVCVTRAPSA